MDVRNKVLHVEKEIKAVQKEILEAGEVTKKLTFMIVFFVVQSGYQKKYPLIWMHTTLCLVEEICYIKAVLYI